MSYYKQPSNDFWALLILYITLLAFIFFSWSRAESSTMHPCSSPEEQDCYRVEHKVEVINKDTEWIWELHEKSRGDSKERYEHEPRRVWTDSGCEIEFIRAGKWAVRFKNDPLTTPVGADSYISTNLELCSEYHDAVTAQVAQSSWWKDTSVYRLVPRYFEWTSMESWWELVCREDPGDPVPEPTSLFLFGSGIVLVSSMIRRRKSRKGE